MDILQELKEYLIAKIAEVDIFSKKEDTDYYLGVGDGYRTVFDWITNQQRKQEVINNTVEKDNRSATAIIG